MTLFVMMEIFVAQSSRRDEPFGAGILQPHEKSKARDACDAGLEDRTLTLFHMGCNVTLR